MIDAPRVGEEDQPNRRQISRGMLIGVVRPRLEETLEMYFSIGILAAVLIGWPKIRSEEIQNDKRSERLPDAR